MSTFNLVNEFCYNTEKFLNSNGEIPFVGVIPCAAHVTFGAVQAAVAGIGLIISGFHYVGSRGSESSKENLKFCALHTKNGVANIIRGIVNGVFNVTFIGNFTMINFRTEDKPWFVSYPGHSTYQKHSEPIKTE